MIKRFEIDVEYDDDHIEHVYMNNTPEGGYCLYSDYSLLEEEYNQLKKGYLHIVKLYEDIKSTHRVPSDYNIIP